MSDLDTLIRAEAVVTLAVVDSSEDAAPLARALLDGGLTTIEVALRTDESLRAIRAIAEAVPDITVLAGTVIHPDQAQEAVSAGASGLVSPGFSSAISSWCAERQIDYVPGVATASEIMTALDHGHRLLKFFPAKQLGGLEMLAALHAPFASHGVSYLLTGGMTESNLGDALRVPYVAAVGGTWIAPVSRVRDHAWAEITASARVARESAIRAREAGASS
jgi:2-dehydro-3-deoxyphosphogluconate aldolase/(4S)-4-hydroxy-2-oxoglutarate aldolase